MKQERRESEQHLLQISAPGRSILQSNFTGERYFNIFLRFTKIFRFCQRDRWKCTIQKSSRQRFPKAGGPVHTGLHSYIRVAIYFVTPGYLPVRGFFISAHILERAAIRCDKRFAHGQTARSLAWCARLRYFLRCWLHR